jgi:hypothetical protein
MFPIALSPADKTRSCFTYDKWRRERRRLKRDENPISTATLLAALVPGKTDSSKHTEGELVPAVNVAFTIHLLLQYRQQDRLCGLVVRVPGY